VIRIPQYLHALGRKGEADEALVLAESKYNHSSPFYIGEQYAARDDLDQTFAWWERAYRQHDGALAQIKLAPADSMSQMLTPDPRPPTPDPRPPTPDPRPPLQGVLEEDEFAGVTIRIQRETVSESRNLRLFLRLRTEKSLLESQSRSSLFYRFGARGFGGRLALTMSSRQLKEVIQVAHTNVGSVASLGALVGGEVHR
jgi:hypothetical protein